MLTRYTQGSTKRLAISLSMLMALTPTLLLGSNASAQTNPDRRPNAYVYQPSSESLTDKELQRFAQSLGDAAKDAVARTNLEVAEVRVKDALLIVDCDAPTPDCMERIAQSTSVQRIYYFDIEREDDLYKMVFKYYDVPSRQFASTERYIEKSPEAPKVFHDLILQYLANELERTRVSVISHEEKLFIKINGKNFGEAPQSIETLVPGAYTLEIVREDKPLWQGNLELEHGVATTIDIEMGPDGKTPIVSQTSGKNRQLLAGAVPDDAPSRYHWGAWTMVGVGAATMATGLIFSGLVVKATNDANDLYNRSQAGEKGLKEQQQEEFKKGKLYETVQFALLGAGGAVLLGGLAWVTYDALKDDEAASPAPETVAGLTGMQDPSLQVGTNPYPSPKLSFSFAPTSIQTQLVW